MLLRVDGWIDLEIREYVRIRYASDRVLFSSKECCEADSPTMAFRSSC